MSRLLDLPFWDYVLQVLCRWYIESGLLQVQFPLHRLRPGLSVSFEGIYFCNAVHVGARN